MKPTKTTLALALFVLPVATCSPVLTLFDVPSHVWAGHEFAVSVWGTDLNSSSGGTVGCVLQLPIGVSVASWTTVPPASPTRDDPSLLSRFIVEPGCYVTSFHGYVQSLFAGITVRLLAPTSLPPNSRIKVVLVTQQGSTWSIPQSSFAQVGGNQAKTITLVSEPPTMVEAQGLPLLSFVATGDVDDDGVDELLGLGSFGTILSTCRLSGAAWTQTTFAMSPTVSNWDCVPADLDGDGNLDLAIGRQVLFGDGAGGWIQGPVFTASGIPRAAVGDVDGDGLPDIAIASSAAQVFHNDGNRTFSSWSSGLPASNLLSGNA